MQDDGPHPHEARYLKLDSSKARARLGWRPRIDLAATLEGIVDWYQRAARRSGHARGDAGADRDVPIRCGPIMSADPLSILPCARRGGLRGPRHVAAGELLPAARAGQQHGAVLPAARARLRAVLPRAAGGVRDARADLLRLRLLLVLLLELAGAQPPLLRADDRAPRPGRGQPRGGDRLQRRLPAAVLPRAPDPRARDRAGGERREGGAAEGHPHAGGVLRPRDRSLAGGRVRGRPAARQQRARPRPRPQRLRRGDEDPAEAGRRDHDGVPPPDEPDRRTSSGTRSTTSTSPTSPFSPSAACSRLTVCACSTSRSCPRTAARCGSTAAHAEEPQKPDTDAARELRERERGAGYERLETYLGYGARSSATSARSWLPRSTSRNRG